MSSDMPDPMSRDPEVKALRVLTESMCGWENPCDLHAKTAADALSALHAAGYRVVAAESERRTAMNEMLELAWGLIANAGGGDWTKESAEWQEAAARWRDAFNEYAAAPIEEERQHE